MIAVPIPPIHLQQLNYVCHSKELRILVFSRLQPSSTVVPAFAQPLQLIDAVWMCRLRWSHRLLQVCRFYCEALTAGFRTPQKRGECRDGPCEYPANLKIILNTRIVPKQRHPNPLGCRPFWCPTWDSPPHCHPPATSHPALPILPAFSPLLPNPILRLMLAENPCFYWKKNE